MQSYLHIALMLCLWLACIWMFVSCAVLIVIQYMFYCYYTWLFLYVVLLLLLLWLTMKQFWLTMKNLTWGILAHIKKKQHAVVDASTNAFQILSHRQICSFFNLCSTYSARSQETTYSWLRTQHQVPPTSHRHRHRIVMRGLMHFNTRGLQHRTDIDVSFL